MKNFNLLLLCILTVLLFACKSGTEPEPEPKGGLTDEEIAALGISKEDAVKKLSYFPTDGVYLKLPDPLIDLLFYSGRSEYIESQVSLTGTCFLWNSIQTVGELIAFYKKQPEIFGSQMSDVSFLPCSNHILYPRIEYLLAQECFHDGCSSMTRKAVLALAVKKTPCKFPEDKWRSPILSKETGVFLMAVILIKEKDADFITAIHENKDLQIALRLIPYEELPLFVFDEEFSCFVMQYVINFLSKE